MTELWRHEFSAMGTTVTLVGPEGEAPGARIEFDLAAEGIRAVFAAMEARFSRFRSDSELSQVNDRAGRSTRISRDFAELLRFSLDAAKATGGLFDPTVLGALIAAGYDCDYRELRTGRPALQDLPPCGRWSDVQLDGCTVLLPAGVGLDFGGVAKGWTVDRAAIGAADALPWALVNAGGDLRIDGIPPEGGLEVRVEDPVDPQEDLVRIRLERGALATSSVLSRVWGPGLHQLIDPRTARPASTGVIQATVWAPTCADAEVRSKWSLLAGPSILHAVPGVLALDDGRVLLNLRTADAERVNRALDVPGELSA